MFTVVAMGGRFQFWRWCQAGVTDDGDVSLVRKAQRRSLMGLWRGCQGKVKTSNRFQCLDVYCGSYGWRFSILEVGSGWR